MTIEEKQCHHIGPGGYKCKCCGPAPKERGKYRRMIRSRLKALFYKAIKRELSEQ